MAAGAAAAMKLWPAALGCLIVAVIAAVVAMVQRHANSDTGHQFDSGPLGKGPYTHFSCVANVEFVDRLSQIAEELCDAATREDWTVDWHGCNQLRDQAAAAREAGDHTRAVRGHCRVISFMMAQLKGQRDSGHGGGLFE